MQGQDARAVDPPCSPLKLPASAPLLVKVQRPWRRRSGGPPADPAGAAAGEAKREVATPSSRCGPAGDARDPGRRRHDGAGECQPHGVLAHTPREPRYLEAALSVQTTRGTEPGRVGDLGLGVPTDLSEESALLFPSCTHMGLNSTRWCEAHCGLEIPSAERPRCARRNP